MSHARVRPRPAPSTTTPLTDRALLVLPATTLATCIRDRQVSARRVMDVHLAHIARVNPTLNVFVAERFAAAREEATAADQQLAKDGPDGVGPLHGVPCSIKESFLLTGMPNATGLVSRAAFRADHDAITVARLRNAGAIPMGVTNTSELCMWMESDNRLYGRTRNPYDPTRIVGGSSGGEGAAVGGGMAPFGLGSDIGGSIRMPAFFNGVFGHKTSPGSVPASGQYPPAGEGQLRMLSTGPLTRSARDLMPLLRLLAGADPGDVTSRDVQWPEPADVLPAGVRVLSVESMGLRRIDKRLIAAQRQAAKALEQAGCRVENRRVDAFRHGLALWSAELAQANGPSYESLLADGGSVSPLRELGRLALRRSNFTLPSIGLALAERVPWLHRPDPKVDAVRAELEHEMRTLLGDDGVLLFPSYTRPAPRHGEPLLTPIDWVHTALFNTLKLPVTQVPLGLDPTGLPLGVQVVAPRDCDHLSIAVAQWLEDAMGGWVPPWEVRGWQQHGMAAVPLD